MASPVTNNNPASVTQQAASVSSAQVSSGVSNVESSMTSVAESQSEGFFAFIVERFEDMFTAISDFFASLFTSEEERVQWRVENRIDALVIGGHDDEILQQCLGYFMHMKNECHQWRAFNKAWRELPAEQIKMFYDLLPAPMQTHLKRHIWEINGGDNNMGIFFGDAIVRDDIKNELVLKAILQCRMEVGF